MGSVGTAGARLESFAGMPNGSQAAAERCDQPPAAAIPWPPLVVTHVCDLTSAEGGRRIRAASTVLLLTAIRSRCHPARFSPAGSVRHGIRAETVALTPSFVALCVE